MNDDKQDITGKNKNAGVVAISQEEGRFKAVALARRGGSFELLWTRSSEPKQRQLEDLAADCGLPAGDGAHSGQESDRMAVVGFDSSGVVFQHIRVPVVKESELDSIVKLQAETRLPLPAEQMELAWRAGKIQDGQVSVTIAAARKESLEDFVSKVRVFEPARILLNSEAVVSSWRRLFSGSDERAVILSIGSRKTQVCLAENGRLVNGVIVDIGIQDFGPAGGSMETMETSEMFSQDINSVLELFGYSDPKEAPVFVLSDGSRAIEGIVSYLKSSGLNAGAALVDVRKLMCKEQVGTDELYGYRVPIGLALLSLDGDIQGLNVFEGLYQPVTKEVKVRWYCRAGLTGAIAGLMLVLLVIVSYAVAVAGDNHLSKLSKESDFAKIIERQSLIKKVARARPDLLGLFGEINSVEADGIKVDTFYFKKGQRVTISGQASQSEQVYKFQEKLNKKSGITTVEISSLKKEKDDKCRFTIGFHYKHFTRKKSVLNF